MFNTFHSSIQNWQLQGWLVRLLTLAAIVLSVLLSSPSQAVAADFELRSLSTRADLVSGGDVLVELIAPAGIEPQSVVLELAGRDISTSFAALPDGRYVGLVSDLAEGSNELIARQPNGQAIALTLINHPITGPVFSGPHLNPLVCSTVEAGLGEPLDEHCSAPVQYRYAYWSTTQDSFQPLDDPDNPPADVAQTTTDQGHTLDFILVIERGVIDRAIYDIAVLYDPENPNPTPWSPGRGWNGKVQWMFSGGGGPDHRQLEPMNILEASRHAYAMGYAVGSTSFNWLQQNVNTVTSAESAMMAMEHLAETYGPIRFVIGAGCSGGSMNVHEIASLYPGLFQGILPSCSFPDYMVASQALLDCVSLWKVFNEDSPQLWSDLTARMAVTGEVAPSMCAVAAESGLDRGLYQPDYGCVGASLLVDPNEILNEPPEWVYNAETNPDGVRCTAQDYMANVFGKERPEGWAGRPYDTVGLQMGLEALNSGAISVSQFLDVNRHLGGFDINYQLIEERTVADPIALERAYQTARVSSGEELEQTVIIDYRGWDPYNIHSDYHSFSMRERLMTANGHADNHVILRAVGEGPFLAAQRPLYERAFFAMDQWLSAMEQDHSAVSLPERIRRNRPESLTDACFLGDGSGEPITDSQQCEVLYPYGQSPHSAAGAPFANNVLKCQLKAPQRGDYEAEFSDEQWSELQAIFSDGVCDWNKPGVSQRPMAHTWLNFDVVGGRPMGAAPVSRSLNNASNTSGTSRGGALSPWLLLLLSLTLTACGGREGSGGRTAEANGLADSQARPGEVYDAYLTVPETGDTVAMTVFEPAEIRQGEQYPLIIQHHGYAGQRARSLDESCNGDCATQNEADFARYVNNGYGLITFDQRGHSESTGFIRGMDPDYAGKGLVAMLDWAEENLDWLAYGTSVDGSDPHNLIVGSIGGSYGGISQLILNAIDPKRRMDAMVPEYTWYDFPTALFPNDALRATMYEGVFALGITAGNAGNYGPTLTEYSLHVLSGARPTPYIHDYWGYHSHSYFCEQKTIATNGGPGTVPELPGLPPPPVHALVMQGTRDTVFVLNDGLKNADCLRAQGGDVRLWGYHIGHEVVDPGNSLFQPSDDLPQNTCAGISKDDASFAFFEEHLKGKRGAADSIPEQDCLALSVTDSVLVDRLMRGKEGTAFDIPPTQAIPGNPIPIAVELDFEVPQGGEVLAGVPHLSIDIQSLASILPGDEILLFGLGQMRSSAPGIWDLIDNQLWPTRGPGHFDMEITGIAERLQPGDRLALLIYGFHEQFNITGALSISQVNATPVTVSGTLWLPLLGDLPNASDTSE